jgi:hypothetical protein
MADNAAGGIRRLDNPKLWWGAATVALLLGFADLWRGGETLAPILLVVAYVILIPIAILRS